MKRSRTKERRNGWAAEGRTHRLYRLLIVRLRAIISSENGHFHAEGSNYPPFVRKLLLLDGQILRLGREKAESTRMEDGTSTTGVASVNRQPFHAAFRLIYKVLIGANVPWRMITCNDFMSEKWNERTIPPSSLYFTYLHVYYDSFVNCSSMIFPLLMWYYDDKCFVFEAKFFIFIWGIWSIIDTSFDKLQFEIFRNADDNIYKIECESELHLV